MALFVVFLDAGLSTYRGLVIGVTKGQSVNFAVDDTIYLAYSYFVIFQSLSYMTGVTLAEMLT